MSPCDAPLAYPANLSWSVVRRIHGWTRAANVYGLKPADTTVAVVEGCAADGSRRLPSAAFYRAAYRALRADEAESVLVVAASAERSVAARALRGLAASVRVLSFLGANASMSHAIHNALLATDHLIVDDPTLARSRAAERKATGATYHGVWVWCGDASCSGRDDDVETSLAWSVVEARRGGSGGGGGGGGGGGSGPTWAPAPIELEVRSTLSPAWRPLPASLTSLDAAELDDRQSSSLPHGHLPHGMWALRDVCVGYSPPRPSIHAQGPLGKRLYHDRKMLLVQTDRGDGGGAGPPPLLWPLRWPRHYADGTATAFQIGDMRYDAAFADVVKWARAPPRFADVVRGRASGGGSPSAVGSAHAGGVAGTPFASAGRSAAAAASRGKLRASWREGGGGGFVVEVTLDNLFHSLFHALPLREDAAAARAQLLQQQAPQQQHRRRRQPQQLQQQEPPPAPLPDLLPRYTVLWPGPFNASASGWRGWQMLERLLADALGSPPAAAAAASPPPGSVGESVGGTDGGTDALLAPYALRCYERLAGGHSPFWPAVDAAADLLAVRPRLATLRDHHLITT